MANEIKPEDVGIDKKFVDKAVAAQGVGLPPVKDTLHTSDVQVNEPDAGDPTKVTLKDKEDAEKAHLRWVSLDQNRDRLGAAMEKGYVPVKAEEAQRHKVFRGNKDATGFQTWGSGDNKMLLMKCKEETFKARKQDSKAARSAQRKRIKEKFADDVRKESGDRLALGEVKISGK